MTNTKISLNENGKLIIPDSIKRPVHLITHPEIQITVNDKQIDDSVEVTVKDEVIFSITGEGEPGEISVTISKDRLNAYLQLKPSIQKYPAIIEKNTIEGIFIEALVQERDNYTLEAKDLQQALADNGVVYEIDQAALTGLLQDPHQEQVLVAKGRAAQPGVNEFVNVLVDTEPVYNLQTSPDDKVNFKRSRTIVTVTPGQELAVKTPGQPGTPGKEVTGAEVPPPDYKRLNLEAGEGAEVQKDGFSIVVTGKGLPVVQTKGDTWFFQVQPVFITSEVNLATGNLEFDGNIIIQKEVAAGMSVFGTGNILIEGATYDAKIIALGNVVVNKNMINTFISAGATSDYMDRLKNTLAEIEQALGKLYQYLTIVVLQYNQQYEGKSLHAGQLITNIISKKFADLPKKVTELDQVLRKKECIVAAEVESVIKELDMKFRRLGWLNTKNSEEVQQLQQRVLKAVALLIADTEEQKGDVVVGYAVNSTIEAAGNVHVSGQGCVNTAINAKGDVTIDAVFRGGTINCAGTVKIREAGSQMGVKTAVKTSGQPVQIETAHPNVNILAGANGRTIHTTEFKLFIQEEAE